jgi:hypothetical protein
VAVDKAAATRLQARAIPDEMKPLRIAVSSAHRVKIALFSMVGATFIRTMVVLGDLVYSDAALAAVVAAGNG